ncbi:MAG: hypothetical protein ACI9K2_000376 [Myxococcota bacterium]
MIVWLALGALAAPVLDTEPIDPWARCVERADRQAGLNGPAGMQAFPVGGVSRLAIVVGVPCHHDPDLPSLAYASRDATQVADWLASENYSVIRLTTEVEQAEMSRALDLAERHLRPGGTLVVYFSGHGVIHQSRGRLQRMLVFTDTHLDDLPGTAMSVDWLEARLATLEASQRVLIQDTCFAGDGGKSIASQPDSAPKGVVPPDAPFDLRPGDHRLYAARFFEQAEESSVYRGSVYTHHLLAALRDGAGDLDGDACIGLREAHMYAQARTDADRRGLQRPIARDWDGENLHLATCTGRPTHAVVTVPAEPPGWVVELADGRAISEPTTVLPGPQSLRVVLETESAGGESRRDVLLDQRLMLQPGQWVEPADELTVRARMLVAEASVEVSGTQGVLPPAGAGVAAWWAPRDKGRGRPVLGAELTTLAKGPVTWSDQRIACFTGGHLAGRLGWLWTVPVDAAERRHMALGPSGTVGGWWREAAHPGSQSGRPCGEPGRGQVGLGTELATGATTTLHVHLASGPWVASFDQGVLWTGTDTASGFSVIAQPTVRAALGVRVW